MSYFCGFLRFPRTIHQIACENQLLQCYNQNFIFCSQNINKRLQKEIKMMQTRKHINIKNTFKSTIATSLALALSVNMASGATDSKPSIFADEENIDSKVGFTWKDDSSSGVFSPVLSSQPQTPINELTFQFGNQTSGSGNATYSATIAGKSLTIRGNGNGIKMNGGNGTLKVNFKKNKGKNFILDLSGVSSNNFALDGNFSLLGIDDLSNITNITFGGKGVSKNVTLDSAGKIDLTLQSGAKIEGNLLLNDGSNTIHVQGDSKTSRFTGGIQSGHPDAGRMSTKILFDTPNGNNQHKLNDTLTLTNGTLTYGFADTVTSGTDFVVDKSKITFNGGWLGFEGARQILIGDNGTDTLTATNGGIKVIVDPKYAQKTILKGNLTLGDSTKENYSGIRFSLKNATSGINPFTDPNASGLDGLPTYHVDGNITLQNAGFSAFWDDRYGFTGKVTATSIKVTGGLIEKNDAWFAKGTFSDSNKPTKINLKNSTGHLVFEDVMNITGGIKIRDGGGKTSQILFKNNAKIGKNGSDYAILAIDGGMTPTLEVFFQGAENSVDGISAQPGTSANTPPNKIVHVVFDSKSGTNTITGEIKAHKHSSGIGTVNIDFNGKSHTISGVINASGGVNNLTFRGNAEITNDIQVSNNGQNKFILAGNGNSLTLKGKSGGANHTITLLKSTGINNKLILDSSNGSQGGGGQ